MAELLDRSEIETRLRKLSVEWALSSNALERDFKFDDFKSALDFVNQVGRTAEDLNHHPDVKLSWGKVSLSITSHNAGGLTGNDFKLAQSIDGLAD